MVLTGSHTSSRKEKKVVSEGDIEGIEMEVKTKIISREELKILK